ncbi:MAG TPA: hypothetical protein VIL86_10710 [Tepidisphaeraceae bacterium]
MKPTEAHRQRHRARVNNPYCAGRSCAVVFSALFTALLAGCGSPSKANIELRRQNAALRDRVELLTKQHQSDVADIERLETAKGALATLPHERMEQLFTANALKLGRLSGGADLEPAKPGDEALKVYVVPTDAAGDAIKAAGAFTIEAFDLDVPEHPLVGTWKFSVEQARESWYGKAMLYEYVLTCPWQAGPTHAKLTVKVTFTDALTGLTLTAKQDVTIKLPAK